jgi:hypothetical protein
MPTADLSGYLGEFATDADVVAHTAGNGWGNYAKGWIYKNTTTGTSRMCNGSGYDPIERISEPRTLYVDGAATTPYENGSAAFPFHSPDTAVAAPVAPSAADRWLVVVKPGTYVFHHLAMRSFVNVVALGGTYYDTIFETDVDDAHFIVGAHDAILQGIGIRGPADVGFACIYNAATTAGTEASFYVRDCAFLRGYYGLWTHHATDPVLTQVDMGAFLYEGVPFHTIYRVTGHGNLMAFAPFVAGPAGCVVAAVLDVEGADARCTCEAAYFEAPLCTHLAFIDDGAQGRLTSATFNGGVTAIHLGNAGAGTLLNATGCIVRWGMHTHDVVVDSATALGRVSGGAADRTKLAINPLANFTLEFSDRTPGNEGIVIIPELFGGISLTDPMPMFRYARSAYFTGLVSGGEVTYAGVGGLHVDVAHGDGFINTGLGVPYIDWIDALSVDVPANSDFWIYVPSTGIVTAAAVEPSDQTTIILAVGRTDGAGVIALAKRITDIAHFRARLSDWMIEAIGPLWKSGLAITEAGASLRFNVAGGSYWISNNERVAAGSSPATFTLWYRDPVNGWAYQTGLLDLDVLHWDDGTGVLAHLAGGEWRKDAIYVMVNDSGTQYHVVLGQEVFANEPAAINGAMPSPPYVLYEYGIRCAGTVITQAGGHIADVIDHRPTIAGAGSGAITTSNKHSTLLNLLNDDHPQYPNRTGNAARNPITGEFDFTLGVLTAPVAAVPAQVKAGSVVVDSTNWRLTFGIGASRKEVLNRGDTSVTGDVQGTFPAGLTVVDLTMAGEAQGDLLFFNGANWVVRAAAVAAGYLLQSGGPAANPTWTNTPIIGNFTNAAHTHQDAAGGARLDHGAAMVPASLLDDDHPQYLLATGGRAGASAAAQDFGTLGVKADVLDVSTAGVGVKVRGSRDFGALAADPAPVIPAIAGDRYYNTALAMQMVYDGGRAKWLSVAETEIEYNKSGNTNAGVYYNAGALIMSATSGFPAFYNGTIVAMGYTRSDNDAATFEVVEGGVTRASLLSSATSGRDTALNANVTAGGVLAVRNSSVGNTTSNVIGWVRMRWRA